MTSIPPATRALSRVSRRSAMDMTRLLTPRRLSTSRTRRCALWGVVWCGAMMGGGGGGKGLIGCLLVSWLVGWLVRSLVCAIQH